MPAEWKVRTRCDLCGENIKLDHQAVLDHAKSHQAASEVSAGS